jgi:hypothetical protein
MSPTFVKQLLLSILDGLALAAQQTATSVDDHAVAMGRAIVEEDLLFQWFLNRAQADDGALALEDDPPVAMQAVLERRKIDWARLVQVATVLIQLLRAFKG